jgi:hypothetical protein
VGYLHIRVGAYTPKTTRSWDVPTFRDRYDETSRKTNGRKQNQPGTLTNEYRTKVSKNKLSKNNDDQGKEVITMNRFLTSRISTSLMALALMLLAIGNHIGPLGVRLP